MRSSRASGSIIAAGVVAILGSCLAVLGCGFVLLGITMLPSSTAEGNLPASIKLMTVAVMLFFLALSVFGIITGAGILRLKNWARVTAVIWAGITTCFGSLSLLFTMFVPIPAPSGSQPLPHLLLKGLLFVFYAIPVGISIWWLVLFNKREIRAQFSGIAISGQPEAPVGPRCPLPVSVIAGFLVISFAFCLVFPLFHIPLPVLLFGLRVRGIPGSGIFALTAVLLLVAAVGLLGLKRWSYPLVLGVQSFWVLSGTITLLSSSYERNMQGVFDEMHLPQQAAMSQIYLHSRTFAVIGLFPSLLILAILLYYRERFFKAAEEAERIGS